MLLIKTPRHNTTGKRILSLEVVLVYTKYIGIVKEPIRDDEGYLYQQLRKQSTKSHKVEN